MGLYLVVPFFVVLLNPLFGNFRLKPEITEHLFPRDLKTDRREVTDHQFIGKNIECCRRRNCKKRKKTSLRNKGQKIVKKSTNTSKKTAPTKAQTKGKMEKAGEFKGDLRDLPKTKPVDQERPKVKEQPDKPIPAPKPTVKPPEN